MKVYLAGSFAYKDEEKTKTHQRQLEWAAHLLKEKGLDVYLPQELHIHNAWDYTPAEWGLMVFTHDVIEIDKADVLVMLSWGKENNAGAAWEVGYAFGTGKKVVVVGLTDEVESAMILHGSYAQVKGMIGLEQYDFATMPKTRDLVGEQS